MVSRCSLTIDGFLSYRISSLSPGRPDVPVYSPRVTQQFSPFRGYPHPPPRNWRNDSVASLQSAVPFGLRFSFVRPPCLDTAICPGEHLVVVVRDLHHLAEGIKRAPWILSKLITIHQ